MHLMYNVYNVHELMKFIFKKKNIKIYHVFGVECVGGMVEGNMIYKF